MHVWSASLPNQSSAYLRGSGTTDMVARGMYAQASLHQGQQAKSTDKCPAFIKETKKTNKAKNNAAHIMWP